MQADESILSVGIDVGTTTTHLVFSRLQIGAGDDPFGRWHVVDREVVYRGRIHPTPIRQEGTADEERIEGIVRREYAAAGVRPEQVVTGAVIITGETSRRRNARRLARRLADLAGGFASATAGPNLESILAARGSGAFEWSRRHRCNVLNVDVGGGTANLAWIENGVLRETACLRVGARHLVRRDGGPWRPNSDLAGRLCGPGGCADAQRFVASLAAALADCAARGEVAPELSALQMSKPDGPPPRAGVMMFSGGVGELMRQIRDGRGIEADLDDLGPLLAEELLVRFDDKPAAIRFPPDPIRATVIGAGMFSVQISGETVWAPAELLPVSDVPVIRPFRNLRQMSTTQEIRRAIERACRLADLDGRGQCVAVALPSLRLADYDRIVTLGRALADAAEQCRLAPPWIWLMQDNYGLLLARAVGAPAGKAPFLVVDEIDVARADLIDIGRPVVRTRPVLPVVVKTLVFDGG